MSPNTSPLWGRRVEDPWSLRSGRPWGSGGSTPPFGLEPYHPLAAESALGLGAAGKDFPCLLLARDFPWLEGSSEPPRKLFLGCFGLIWFGHLVGKGLIAQ